jgi:2-polyprenyl-6-methoxyphenol hydroxylase-like FAD-dependent oxidoreductase
MSINNNIVIVGAGPIGITTACTLKALNKELNICVVDKRPEPGRSHGLRVQSDSVAKINELLTNALLQKDSNVDVNNVNKLKGIFNQWIRGNNFPRTSEIENTLGNAAKEMGIEVIRDKDCEISQKAEITYEDLLKPEEPANLTSKQNTLRNIFQKASVIIGADGAHSEVRKQIFGEKLVDQKTLQYIIELKYQTEGKAQPRGVFTGLMHAYKCGHVDFENMAKQKMSEKKPATLHVFVDQETYNDLRPIIDGKQKGVFGNSWSLKEIKELAKTNPRVKDVYHDIMHNLKDAKRKEGKCSEEQISTLEIGVYRSEESVKIHHGKHILLIGDANSGMVLERGFNKGLKEVALCAKAVADFFKRPVQSNASVQKVPKEFKCYQKETRKIFSNEKWWAEFKNYWIVMAQKIVKLISTYIAKPFYRTFIKPFRTKHPVCLHSKRITA